MANDNKKSKFTLEDLGAFELQVKHAKQMGEEWVETSPEIIKYLVPQGIEKEGHFIYNSVYVCEFGKKDAAIAKMSEDLNAKIHGAGEGVLEGRG